MISIKTPEELTYMREGGKKLGAILQELLSLADVGTNLQDLEKTAAQRITEAGGEPSFPTVEGYPYVTCLCLNEEVVHGMPRNYILQQADVLTIDIGMIYHGLHTDTASTIAIGAGVHPDVKQFLSVGQDALQRAISVAFAGNRVGNISSAIQATIEQSGYHVVRELTGHGVGKVLHEEPMIPEYIRGDIQKTPLLTSGMTIAIEVIYAQGQGDIVYKGEDGWTIASKDHSLTATFEHTIEIRTEQSLVLTEREVYGKIKP